MPPPRKGDVTLSKPGDWLDWYDGLLDFARGHELDDLVDIEKNKPVSEILLPKPEKPNPLALFPQLLDTLSPEAFKQVAIPVRDRRGVAVNPPRYTFVRNQAIEDDSLVYLGVVQAAGWKTRLNTYNQREAEWRTQRKGVLAIRRWIDNHIDPAVAYCIRAVDGAREAVEALRSAFPCLKERQVVIDQYKEINAKAGTGLDLRDWFRQWCLVYDRTLRLEERWYLSDEHMANDFLDAVAKYEPWEHWAMVHQVGLKWSGRDGGPPCLCPN